MATFSAPTFSFTSYQNSRPPPPASLTTSILSLLPPPHNTLIDLGCGPGIATIPFLQLSDFKSVIGFDASEGMISQAREVLTNKIMQEELGEKAERVRFEVSGAEKLPLKDRSVDLVIAQTAVHWFPICEWQREMERIVRPGGVVAFWGYIDGGIEDAVEASKVYLEWIHDGDKLGPYWEWEGKEIMRSWYKDVVWDPEEWVDRRYWYHKASADTKEDPPVREGEEEVGDRKEIFVFDFTLEQLAEMFNTWSAVHRWKEAHPGVDVIELMMQDMVRKETSWGYTEEDIITGKWKTRQVRFVWDTTVIIARRKGSA